MFKIYCSTLGNCFDVKVTTADYGDEYSWSLGTCSNNQVYSHFKEYNEECCLDAGVHTLKCKDSYGDGWVGGFINIQGKIYCDNFKGGYEKAVEVTITTSKYIFVND